MYNHTRSDYICPICLGIKNIESSDTLLKRQDLIYRDETVSAFLNSFFIVGNEGHVIVVPNDHCENIYDMPEYIGHRIFDIARKIAIAMKKSYNCDGITTRQNNEPAGDQHAFHFHFHIFPRYENDNFNQNSRTKKLATPEERLPFVMKLRKQLEEEK